MKNSTEDAVSELFQELIVSKIKDEIDLLRKEISSGTEFGENIDAAIDKLPKASFIKKLVEEEKTNVNKHIDESVFKSQAQTEKYLKDIAEYLKKQYGFADKKTLCAYLYELSGALGTKLDIIINGQAISSEQYVAISSEIEKNKMSILSCIETNQTNLVGGIQQYHGEFVNYYSKTTEHLSSIIGKNNEGNSRLNRIEVEIDGINECLNRIETNEHTLLANLGDDSDIVSILNRIFSDMGYEINSDNNESVKSDLNEINSLLKKVIVYSQNQEDTFNTYIEENKSENEKINQKIKLLSILNAISIVGVISILIIQFV